ncbi:glycosyltransferase [Candidatus Parcubacteria bacterium]|nr:MAG: glycosyltransferase [Candidatus Parcubacteria bacterium]
MKYLGLIKRIIFILKRKWQPFFLPKNEIHLHYGGVLNLQKSGIITGGKIKLLHLHSRFPENKYEFNILYLVSSALPKYAEELVSWSKKNGVKVVWNQNGVGYSGWAGEDTEKVNAPLRHLIDQADFVLYQSLFCKRSADIFLEEISTPWRICHNCVDTSFFSPPTQKDSFETWNLISAGTHLKWPERVLKALETVAVLKKRGHKVKFLLAGNLLWNNANEDVASAIERLNIETDVEMIYAYKQDDARLMYQKSHVLLHPMYNDACPTVPIEAMACGVPVVGSKSGGMTEIVGDEGGILIDVPESWERYHFPKADKMAGAVEKIILKWSEYSRSARKRALELFDKESWIKIHEEVFKTVLQ